MRFFPLWIVLVACAAEVEDTADTNEIDPECVDAQLVTYNNFGESFMTHSCQGCHASTAPNRYGAPEEVSFDDLDAVWRQAATILAVSTGPAPSMPPQGGVTGIQRTKLQWWLRCGEEGR